MRKTTKLFTLAGISLCAALTFAHITPPACHAQAGIYMQTDATGNAISPLDDDPQAYRELSSTNDSLSQSALTVPNSLSNYSHNSRFSGYDVIKGIDVSLYQKDINFKKVKKSGIDFAFIRVAYRGYGTGAIATDPLYETNIKNALAAGVDVGVYIFSQATTEAEAIEEAEYAVSLIRGYDIQLPVVLDYEYASTSSGLGGRLYKAKLSKSKATKVCNAFCKAVETMGYTAAVYANRSMLESQLYADEIYDNYNIWLANYVSKTGYAGDYNYWQYSSTGSVKGIQGHVDCNFRYMIQPDIPESFEAVTTDYTSTVLSWEKVPGVYGYQISRSVDMGATYQTIAAIRGAGKTTYTDDTLAPGRTYLYHVDAYYQLADGDISSESDEALTITTPALSPGQLAASNISDTALTLNWTESASATGYMLYRSMDGKNYTAITTLPSGSYHYTDQNLTAGTTYYYQLAAGSYAQDGSITYTPESSRMTLAVTTACPPPAQLQVTGYGIHDITLSWSSCPNADTYHIRKYDELTDSYEEIANTTAGTTSKKLTGLTAGTHYTFEVVCGIFHDGKTIYSPSGTGIEAATKSSAPKKFRVDKAFTASIRLKWKAQDGADGYIIYRYDATTGTYKQIKKITNPCTTSYKNTKLAKTTGYRYRICSYQKIAGQIYYGTVSDTIYAATAPAKVTKLKAACQKKQIKLTWKKSKGATGYIIYRYDKKSKTYKKLKTIKANSYTHKKLKRYTQYKYKVVPYKTYKGIKYKGAAVTCTARTK